MNLRDSKLARRPERISPALCIAVVTACAAASLWLLRRRAGSWSASARVLRSIAPGLGSAACVLAMYYTDHGPSLLRLACTSVFLQILMIALYRLKHAPART